MFVFQMRAGMNAAILSRLAGDNIRGLSGVNPPLQMTSMSRKLFLAINTK